MNIIAKNRRVIVVWNEWIRDIEEEIKKNYIFKKFKRKK